jgi:O-antigen ligase/Tfp pilus assembly protein PilF
VIRSAALYAGADLAVGALLGAVLFFPAVLSLLGFFSASLLSDSGAQSGVGAGILRGLVLVAGALWLLLPRRLPPVLVRLAPAGGVFLLLVLASSWASQQVRDALVVWGDYLAVGLAFLLAADLAAAAGARHRNLLAWAGALFLVAVFLTIPTAYAIFLQVRVQQPDVAMYGTFYQANMLASYLLMGLPLSLIVFVRTLDPEADNQEEAIRSPALAGIFLGPLVVALYFTYSRGAWALGALFALLTLALYPASALQGAWWRVLLPFAWMLVSALVVVGGGGQPWALGAAGLFFVFSVAALWPGLPGRRRLLVGTLVLALLSCALLAVLVLPGQMVERTRQRLGPLAQGTDPSMQARLQLWQAGWGMALDHPWLGVGPDGFQRYYPQYQTDLRWFSKFAHSFYITVLSEAGFPALLALGVLLVLGALQGLGVLRADGGHSRRLYRLGFLLGVAAFLAHSAIDVQWQFLALPLAAALAAGVALGSPGPALEAPEGPEEQEEERSPWSLRPQMAGQFLLAVLLWLLVLGDLRITLGEQRARAAQEAEKAGRRQLAASLYDEALLADPWQSDYYRAKALMLRGRREPQARAEYLRLMQKAVAADPHRSVNQNLLGQALRESGRRKEAEAHLRRALELDPVNYPGAYLDLVEFEPDGGRQILERAIQRFPLDSLKDMFAFRAEAIKQPLSQVYSRLALVLDPLKEPGRAEELCRTALLLDPDNHVASFVLGVALFAQGRYSQAAEQFEKVRAREPRHRINLEFLSETYHRLGRDAQAREIYQLLRDR